MAGQSNDIALFSFLHKMF